MRNERITEEEVDRKIDIEQCPECGHSWEDEGPAHYHDCRYFTLDDEVTDDEEEHEMQFRMREAQLALFKTAA